MLPVLILFAKKPVAGQVKTRLCPPLSNLQAAQLARKLIELSVMRVTQYWPGPVELWLWPDVEDQSLKDLCHSNSVRMRCQSDGDLGEKMYIAISTTLNEGQPVMIMGCDIPHCPATVLQNASNALDQGKNVIGPTHDGGYYCIGFNESHPAMFNHIHWGTELAFKQTLQQCQYAGIEFEFRLPILHDLDTYEDLVRIAGDTRALKAFLMQ